jgi:L,D-transpeptidase YcbB
MGTVGAAARENPPKIWRHILCLEVGIMRLLQCSLLPLAIAALLASGCRTADTSPQLSSALQQVVAGTSLVDKPAAWKEVGEFYARREHKPAWVDDKYPSEAAGSALVVLRSSVVHGFSPEDYGETEIVQLHAALNALEKDAPDRVEQLATFEARVTASLLALGHDVALGRTEPSTVSADWKSQREAPPLAGTLAQAVESGSVETWLDQVRPPHAEYAALQKAYGDLRGQQETGGWPSVPAGKFKRGQSDPAVVALRQRLAASGMLADEAATNNSPLFDEDIDVAVRAFQELHAIKATGVVDKLTLAALNVPIEQRLQQVAINLERWRWMPDELGDRHLFVNIPYYHLIVRENGEPVMDMRVVVGKPGNETPIFSDEMETVVFSPYWNIPDSIKQGETAPAAMKDPSYLDRNNIEVLRGSRRVDVRTINWNNPAELRQLAFRQRPGAGNALGQVKFLFPNEFDVYLHDTPADSLFERRGRAFSHGCVRVEEPFALAKYILRGYQEWDDAQIKRAMRAGTERHVKLNETIPVHIAYFTAWVDPKGGLHFQPDVYGYDEKQAAHTGRADRLMT